MHIPMQYHYAAMHGQQFQHFPSMIPTMYPPQYVHQPIQPNQMMMPPISASQQSTETNTQQQQPQQLPPAEDLLISFD